MRNEPPQLPSLDVVRQILHGDKPGKSRLKPTGRYFVSAAAFQGLLLAVSDTDQRVSARAIGELSFEYEGKAWTIVRSTSIKQGVCVEYE